MMLSMPKVDRVPSHRPSMSAVSAAGSLRTSSWSTKDDETLIQARAQGLNWNQIAPRHFPTKSPNACRKRHERLMEKQNAEQWDCIKLDVLAQAYMECRREMWSILASRVGEKWTLVEQKCMEKGLKNLNQAHRSAQKKQGLSYEGDSGVGVSDLDEDSSPTDPVAAESSYGHVYQHAYPSQQHQRVPSIHSMLQAHPPPQLSMSAYTHHYPTA